MKRLKSDFYNKTFSHIYVEKQVMDHELTKRILEHYKDARIIYIDHYKDVFNRSRQDYVRQHSAQKLILAKQQGNLIYEGAPVCQSFGNEYFYYTSCIMNCIFDCEYCYLKGMYPSGNMVIFVNLEDTFEEIKKILKEHPMYICVSYDTDLLALENLIGYVRKWIRFVEENPELTIEIRTKSGNIDLWDELPVQDRVIYAFTISSEKVIEDYEHGTASMVQRIKTVQRAMETGNKARLCFDPMIYCDNWKTHYEEMLQKVYDSLDMDNIIDVSVGSFRVSQDYLKKMRKNEPGSAVVQFPYQNTGGYYHYPDRLLEEMESFMANALNKRIPEDKIFRWKEM